MNINNEIETILIEINKTENYTRKYDDDFYDDEDEDDDGDNRAYTNLQNYKITIDKLIQEQLITQNEFDRRLFLTDKGKDIINNGGWLKYLNSIKENKEKEIEKNNYDFLTKKWIYKTRYLPLIFSFFALIISIYAAFFKDKKENISTGIKLNKLETSIEKNGKHTKNKTIGK